MSLSRGIVLLVALYGLMGFSALSAALSEGAIPSARVGGVVARSESGNNVLLSVESRLTKRLDKLEQQIEGRGLVKLYLKLDQLQKSLGGLQERLDQLENENQALRQRQKQLYLDADRRMMKMDRELRLISDTRHSVSPVLTVTSESDHHVIKSVSPVSGTQRVPSSISVDQDRRDYQKAFALLRESKYPLAIEKFKAFLVTYPDSNYAPNAQYWIGEAYYVQRSFRQAIQAFSVVFTRWPESNKVTDSLLKQGFSYYEVGDFSQAKSTLESLIKDYSESTAARLARSRLKKIREK
jgi:tol-pal system protein YbgF